MRCSLAVLVLCCCASFTMPKYEDGLKNVGNTAGYKIASSYLREAMNLSVDPCEDFFEFTCGNWIANHPVPFDDYTYSQYENISTKVEEKMREILESSENLGSKSIDALKAKYSRCMDKDELNRFGARVLLERIRSFGIWPILEGDDKWRVENFDLTSLLIHVSKIRRVHVFVKHTISLDSRNVSRCLIQFDRGSLKLAADSYLDKETFGETAYRQFLTDLVARLLQDAGLPKNETKIANDVDEIIDLETRLGNITAPKVNRRNHTEMYNLRRLSCMQKLIPSVNWTRYFHSIAPDDVHDYFSSNPEIVIVEIDYMRRVADILQSTDPRIITNYVYLKYASIWVEEMGEQYENISQALHGKKQREPRWKVCTKDIMLGEMQYAVGAMYVRKAFDQASKNVTLEIIDNLLEVFYEVVLKNDWMDTKTKAMALDKAKQMLRHIAYPDFILDNKKLDAYYSGLSVEGTDSYSQMMEKLSRWAIEHEFRRLVKPVDRNDFDFNPVMANAAHETSSNSIKIPAAMLQFPFFHRTAPRALNYGGIGTIIAHEITHGFDDQGRQYDSIGNLREWWDADVKERFEERAQCIIDQYEKIDVPGTVLNISGELTLGENIADNGAIKQSYMAYKNYLRRHGKEKRIKGLEQFNNEQMFFLGYGLSYCENMTRTHLIYLLLSDNHSPSRTRVNQVLANYPEFAAAFHCRVGTPMNPTKRCAVW